jgi:hypothetical protein
MEHAPILPGGLSPEALDTLAMHGLRELAGAPIAKTARALAHFDREQLGIAIEIMVALLDAADGDPDAETGNDVEDDFVLTPGAMERAISDPRIDIVDQDQGAYVEWHTKPANRRRSGQSEFTIGHEDDEDDDPAEEDDDSGQCDEDGVNTLGDLAMHALQSSGPGCDLADPGGQCTEDEISSGNPYFGRTGPGCAISDNDCEHDGREREQGY